MVYFASPLLLLLRRAAEGRVAQYLRLDPLDPRGRDAIFDLNLLRPALPLLCYCPPSRSSIPTHLHSGTTMFKLVAILASLLSASAFTPAPAVARSSALKMGFESELGAQPPLGFWDPLGVLKYADQARFDRLREVEIKHGRISMLAILGHIVTAAGIRLPGEIAFGLKFSDMKAGLAALDTIPQGGLQQLVVFIGLIEIGFNFRKAEIEEAQIRQSKRLFKWDDATIARKSAIELNNGRAAQMGILALMVHEKLNNDPYVINTLLGAPVPFNQ